jgi:hypothetical protein
MSVHHCQSCSAETHVTADGKYLIKLSVCNKRPGEDRRTHKAEEKKDSTQRHIEWIITTWAI